MYSSMETMPLDGKTAHQCGDVCVMCILLAKSFPSEVIFYSESILEIFASFALDKYVRTFPVNTFSR